jgi:hypothetical protein
MPAKLFVRLDGQRTSAGAVRVLPELHRPSDITKNPALLDFFESIKSSPDSLHTCTVAGYSICIEYHPDWNDQIVRSGGLAQESPTEVEQHALYLKAKEKESQLRVSGPAVLCVGSDTSPVLSPGHDPRGPSLQAVVPRIFGFSSISALMVTKIDNRPSYLAPFERHAKTDIFINRSARYRLEPSEVRQIEKITFNHWKYTAPLDHWRERPSRKVGSAFGTLVWRYTPMGVEIEVPATLVLEALAGKNDAIQAFRLENDDVITRALNEGWQMVSCSIKDGEIEKGEPKKVVITLDNLPPFFSVNRKPKTGKVQGV